MLDRTTQTAVSHIQIAETLLQQFDVAERKLPQALAMADKQMLVAEANQTYLDLWSQLRDAAKVLGDAGRDVSRFEQLRASLGDKEHLGGLSEVSQVSDMAVAGLVLGGGISQSATFSLNSPGAAVARKAVLALRELTPEFDWAAADAQNQALSAGIPWKTVVIVACFAAIGLGLVAAL